MQSLPIPCELSETSIQGAYCSFLPGGATIETVPSYRNDLRSSFRKLGDAAEASALLARTQQDERR
jgi:hypothetical protein